jgi:hypothetical protein
MVAIWPAEVPSSWMRTSTGRQLRPYAHIVDAIRRGDRTRRVFGEHPSNGTVLIHHPKTYPVKPITPPSDVADKRRLTPGLSQPRLVAGCLGAKA